MRYITRYMIMVLLPLVSSASALTSISIESNATTLNLGEKAELTLIGTYSDSSTKELDANIEWIVTPAGSAEINGSVLTAKRDGDITLQAKVDNILSNRLPLTIHWEVNGHRLPPEPDKAFNDSTLLGIDSNDNGVRDDVERWIYTKYDTYLPCQNVEVNVTIPATGEVVSGSKEVCEEKRKPYHQIVREIAMQGARAAQIIIQEPEKARETRIYTSKMISCNNYFSFSAKYNNEPLLVDHFIWNDEFTDIQFNTSMRVSAYAKYSVALSGGVYSTDIRSQIEREGCDFNVTELLKGK